MQHIFSVSLKTILWNLFIIDMCYITIAISIKSITIMHSYRILLQCQLDKVPLIMMFVCFSSMQYESRSCRICCRVPSKKSCITSGSSAPLHMLNASVHCCAWDCKVRNGKNSSRNCGNLNKVYQYNNIIPLSSSRFLCPSNDDNDDMHY